MSYSPLVSYFNQSPNYESRNGEKIRGFAIHCFVGQVGLPRGVDVFKPLSKDASANYVIAYDGAIGAPLHDEQRSYCTSSRIDAKVLSIECASDAVSPYSINKKVYDALICLLVDRCKAYGIKKLSWANDAEYGRQLKLDENYQNVVCHRWYANKACPGEDILSKLPAICKEVSRILAGEEPAPDPPTPEPPTPEPPEPYDYCDIEDIRILGIDDEGNDVAMLQAMLQEKGYDLEYCGGCDGIFGDGTEETVMKYQRNNGLDVDGVVGAKTWKSLLGVK